MTMTIEKEAGNAWNRLRAEIDELNSKGTEPPVYRAALTLPLTQAGITAVVGAIAEFPSGFTLFMLNTGGAGEVFLICAIDGVWRVWAVTPSSGGMPLIDPAVVNNFALQNADGSLYDAGFGAGAFDPAGTTATHAALTGTAVHGLGTAALLTSTAVGEDLVTAVDVDGARETIDLPPQFNRPRHFDWQSGVWQSVDVVGSGTAGITAGIYHNLATGTTANSRIRHNINTNIFMLNRGGTGVDWTRRLDASLQIRGAATSAEGVFRVIIGKTIAEAFGVPAAGNYVAVTVENLTITTGHVCKAGVLTTVALTPTVVQSNNAIHITSNNGAVSWYSNGILLGTTTEGPILSNASGTLNLEIENGVTAANYSMRLVGESWGY